MILYNFVRECARKKARAAFYRPRLRGLSVRGGQAPALRCSAWPLFTVGRGPVPRRASRLEQDKSRIYKICKINKIIGAGCKAVPGRRMRPRSIGRERQLSPVRALAIPNYRGGGRTLAGDRPPHYAPLGVFFVTPLAGDRPPHYGSREINPAA